MRGRPHPSVSPLTPECSPSPGTQGRPWSPRACQAFALPTGPHLSCPLTAPHGAEPPRSSDHPPASPQDCRSPRLTADHHVPSAHPSAWHMACALQAFAECMHDISDTPGLSTLCPHLDASMTTQVEVKLSRMGDFRVHGCACWNVSAFPNLEQHKSPLDAAGDGKVMQASKQDSATLSSILKTLSWTMHLLRTIAQHSNEDHGIWSHHFMGNRWGNSGNSVRLYFSGLQNHYRW